MTTATKLKTADLINIALHKNAIAVNKIFDDGSRVYEFADMHDALDFANAAISIINSTTNHEAGLSEPCAVQSPQWIDATAVEVFVPTIEVMFEDHFQIEGLLVVDAAGLPVGIWVTECDDEDYEELEGDSLVGTVLPF